MIDELQEWIRATESKEEGAQSKLAERLVHAPIEWLVRCAEHRHASVRASAAEALPARVDGQCAQLAVRLSRDREGEVRLALARAMALATILELGSAIDAQASLA